MDLTTVALPLAPFVGLLACMLVHVLVSRTAPRRRRVHGIAVSVLAGFGAVAAMALAFAARSAAWPSTAQPGGVAAVWILTYLLLTYCYVIGFFNLGESARRIRLLIELHATGERGMTIEEILATYNARMIVEVRSQRLVSGGQIVERGGRYFIKGRLMLYAAKALVLLKFVFLRGRSELSRRAPFANPR